MRAETLTHEGRTVHLREFDHWLDFLRCAERVENENADGVFNGDYCASLKEGDANWYGTSSLSEAIDLAYNGWSEGKNRIEALRDKLSINDLLPSSQRLRSVFDTAGDEPDIDRFLAGEPEHMGTLHERELRAQGKLVRIEVNRSARCDISAERITRRGVGLLMAMELLMLLGYAVEITISEAVSGENSERLELFIPVLHAGDPLNMDSFAFLLMHPAVLRRLVFAAEETESEEIRRTFGFCVGRGYGNPKNTTVNKGADLSIGWEDGLLRDNSEIPDFARSILKRVGINTEPTN
jgi:hypothetical protein